MLKAVLLLMLNISLFAHTGVHEASGFSAGFSHPIGGADHVLAMVAVGLWAAMIGGRATWIVPVGFVSMMSVGAFMGIGGLEVSFVEEAILASVIAMGVLIAFGIKFNVVLSTVIVGVFAFFHGVAHGAEMPLNASGFEYGIGFIIATTILHIVGIAIGIALERFSKRSISQVAGGAIALSGVALGFM